jgi:hypothetical protein
MTENGFSGVARPENEGATGEACMHRLDTNHLNGLALPLGSISERAAISTCNRYERVTIIASLRMKVRDKKMIRIVIRGEPWYIPMRKVSP